MPLFHDQLLNLATALGVGLLIGTERGWSARATEDAAEDMGAQTGGDAAGNEQNGHKTPPNGRMPENEG